MFAIISSILSSHFSFSFFSLPRHNNSDPGVTKHTLVSILPTTVRAFIFFLEKTTTTAISPLLVDSHRNNCLFVCFVLYCSPSSSYVVSSFFLPVCVDHHTRYLFKRLQRTSQLRDSGGLNQETKPNERTTARAPRSSLVRAACCCYNVCCAAANLLRDCRLPTSSTHSIMGSTQGAHVCTVQPAGSLRTENSALARVSQYHEHLAAHINARYRGTNSPA